MDLDVDIPFVKVTLGGLADEGWVLWGVVRVGSCRGGIGGG